MSEWHTACNDIQYELQQIIDPACFVKIAGSAAMMGYNNLLWEDRHDIDVFTNDDKFTYRDVDLLHDFQYIRTKNGPSYSGNAFIKRVDEYWNSKHKVKVDVVVCKPHIDNTMDIMNTFDLNQSQYYYDQVLNEFVFGGSDQDDLVIKKVPAHMPWSKLFERVAKYQRMLPKKKVYFKIGV